MEENLRCRLCSKTEAITTMIDVPDEDDIHTKINSYLALEVRNHNGLPTSICILCCGKLDNFHDFVVNIRKVQDEFAPATKNGETHSSIELENGNKHDEVAFTYHDFESETKYNPDCDMQMDTEIPTKRSRKRRSALEAKPTRKSNRFKPISKLQSTKKDVCIQVGTTLATDVENLKRNSTFKLHNLQKMEILALLPRKLEPGRSISADSETSRSCLAKVNLAAKTEDGEIFMAPPSDSNSNQLIKLPPFRISK